MTAMRSRQTNYAFGGLVLHVSHLSKAFVDIFLAAFLSRVDASMDGFKHRTPGWYTFMHDESVPVPALYAALESHEQRLSKNLPGCGRLFESLRDALLLWQSAAALGGPFDPAMIIDVLRDRCDAWGRATFSGTSVSLLHQGPGVYQTAKSRIVQHPLEWTWTDGTV